MSRRRKLTDTTPFDTLRLEGSLFVPELLERAARGEAAHQKEADYAVPKGLKLQDEYGRAYRIAMALWQDFATQLPRTDLDPVKTTTAFVLDLLRQCLGYTDLTLLSNPMQIGDRGFPVTAQALGGRIPIIIAPHHLALDDPDSRFAIHGSGARRKSAHQLAQEFLNASRECLWAIVINGRSLRLLRDAETLTRPNFLEFDLETIFREGEARYADFSALWRILHASRSGTAHAPTIPPTECIWEKWKTEGHAQGLRVRNGLREGVTQALLILGRGFLIHPDNNALRQRLHDGTLTKEDYFQQLLRLIYRNLFLFCSEERDLLHTPVPADAEPSSISQHTAARKAYAEGYSLRRLRNRALRHTAHDSHSDLWLSLRVVFGALAKGQPLLALPALGGLFAESQCPDLDRATLANRDLLAAMRQLRWSNASSSLSAIDYRNMGPEELGSVYESLLELVPQLDLPARTFGFAGITDTGSTSGNARKTTGSYYTPDSLVQELIKSALDPVIADRLASQPDRPIEALLSITVCDPSCGSGHFLLAAARRLAEKLAELRAPDGAVRPDDYRHALREVASRCLYGVDINPMAVELCRVALWLETVDPGKPLGFLNHHIRSGNSLLGTTPDLIAAGLPDDTFKPIEGDDKAACAELKKRNKNEREGFGPLFEKEEQTIRDRLRLAATQIEAMDDSQPAALQQKEAAFTTSETSTDYCRAKLLADLWCAAFVIKKHYPGGEGESSTSSSSSLSAQPIEGHLLHTQDELFGQSTPSPGTKAANKKQPKTKNQEQGTARGITTAHLRDFVQGKPLPADLQTEVEALSHQHNFLHWHLAFPQIFDQSGFDCILGNPPWEKLQTEEQQFFSIHGPSIAALTGSTRKAAIQRLEQSDPQLFEKWKDQCRHDAGTISFCRSSNSYPLTAVGKFNSFALFAELNARLANKRGRVGCIVPSGISTDDTTKAFFGALVTSKSLVSLYDFENRLGLFPEVDSRMRFCLLTCGGQLFQTLEEAQFMFYATSVDDLRDDEKLFRLTPDDISLLNPNTRNCPAFRMSSEAELAKHIYRHHPILLEEVNPQKNGFDLRVWRLLNTTDDSGDFVTPTDGPSADFVPVIEAKTIHQFDHRFASFEKGGDGFEVRDFVSAEKEDPTRLSRARNYITDKRLRDRLPEPLRNRGWFFTLRNISCATNERTSIASVIPRGASCEVTPYVETKLGAEGASLLVAAFNSFIFDFLTRQKVGGTHISYFILYQLPICRASVLQEPCLWGSDPKTQIPNPPSLRDWLLPRVLELTYTAWDLEAFAAGCGWSGPPFRWDEERRFLLRCELDAAFFHLYLGPQAEWQQQPEALTRAFPTPRHAVSYIMDTFPIVKRKDEAKHGHYRTKDTILQIYDALGVAMSNGVSYQTLLNPPPADAACCHPPREETLPAARQHWQDSGFALLSPVRKKVYNYPLAVWPELIRQWDKDLDFETFRKAYWLLCERDQFEQEGKKLLPDIPAAWWNSRKESLDAKDFIPSLKGSATIGDLKVWRKEGGRHIQWTGPLPEGLIHEAVDDARIALQIASQMTDDAGLEAEEMAEIESLLLTLENA